VARPISKVFSSPGWALPQASTTPPASKSSSDDSCITTDQSLEFRSFISPSYLVGTYLAQETWHPENSRHHASHHIGRRRVCHRSI